MEDIIGIDISKGTLDAYWLSSREHRQFCNDRAGVTALALWARKACVSRVIFESTGIYHRLLETGLAQYGISIARVNPRQARRFCEGGGQLAKTDRVDATMLAKMGALLELKADQTTFKADKELRAHEAILTSIPGIASVTACAILTDMPELGHLSGKQAAKLAGLAPISRQSGK